MLEWVSGATNDEEVTERSFVVHNADRRVPGVLWTPVDAIAPTPLVLLGHGGAGHKRDDSRLEQAHSYARDHGIATAAIDGPFHGERTPPGPPTPHVYDAALIDAMVGDWRATLDAIVALPQIDESRIGYGGTSMGTMFGLPFVVADGRVRACVLGLCGLNTDQDEVDADFVARLRDDAPRLRCPVLFLLQWDDELFPRDGVLELFGLLGSEDRRLYANPGLHHETPEHVRPLARAFLASQLWA